MVKSHKAQEFSTQAPIIIMSICGNFLTRLKSALQEERCVVSEIAYSM